MSEEGEKHEFEQQLERALCARFQHFKDQSDSLTLESVRRLIEKDLDLKEFSLDVHKKFIRKFLDKKMEDADEDEPSTENVDEDEHASKEAEMLPEKNEKKIEKKKTSTGDEEILEDSPIMGVLTPKSDFASQESSISESSIKKAIWKRADHFQSNSENITLKGVRQLLEEDLGLEKNSLDIYKKFISQEIDQVLSSPKDAKVVKDVKKKASDNVKAKKSKKASSEERSDSSHSESDDMEVKLKPRKEAASKRNIKKSEQPKKRKISEESDSDISGKKQKKTAKKQKEEVSDNAEDGSQSEDGVEKTAQRKEKPASASGMKQKKPAKRQKEEVSDNDEDGSQSEDGVAKTAQRKEKPASAYGKRVENLKTIIKACGMSVAPVIYKKAKQVPEEKREAFIVKELEDILSREGLSKNPSDKEIKDCKRRKDTARELEGIDTTNIISSSRRRSTFSFASPVTPVIRAKKDKVDAKVSKSKNKDKNHKDDDEDEEKKEKDSEEEEEEKKDKEDGKEEKEKDDEEGVEEEVEDEDEEEEEEEEEEESESEEFNEEDDDSD